MQSVNTTKQTFLTKAIIQPLMLTLIIAINGTVSANTYTVSNINDSGAGSLRQAVTDANSSSGPDNITFSIPDGSIIQLTSNEISISDDLIITGPTPNSPSSIIVKAPQDSRIFHAHNASLTLENITLTNGAPIVLTATDSIIDDSSGGAIKFTSQSFSPPPSLRLNDTKIFKNKSLAAGGAIYSTDAVYITRSTIEGNRTIERYGKGGAIYSRSEIIINQSTISGNYTNGDDSDGGGIYTESLLTLNQSTVSGNSTEGSFSNGGGINAFIIIINQSSISGNSVATSSSGGGVFISKLSILDQPRSATNQKNYTLRVLASPVQNSIKQSTITDNFSPSGARGISVFLRDQFFISNSIISGNSGESTDIELRNISGTGGELHLSNNLIGSAKQDIDFYGIFIFTDEDNIFNEDDPKLDALQDNGGLTLTHLPLQDSPAIDKGSNSLAPSITDQRGTGYFRVLGKTIAPATGSTVDIGATERMIILNPSQCVKQ